MIKLHSDIVQEIDLARSGGGTTRGRDCFRVFRAELKNSYRKFVSNDEEEKVREGYLRFYKAHESDLGHYLRNLYHVLKFIDESPHVDRRYRSFLRAQLSANELTLLFYNCLGLDGQKTKVLVENYAMLKNISDDGPTPHSPCLLCRVCVRGTLPH